MIVADANLLAYLVMPGARTGEAEAVLAKDPTWVAPALWRSELRSVVHKYIMRGDLTVARAVTLLGQVDEVLGGREGDVNSQAVLDLASHSHCTTYDCEYVALANTLGVPLITTDRAVLTAFPKCAMTPAQFLGDRPPP
jgi:predicted nucleic acid-binding protein